MPLNIPNLLTWLRIIAIPLFVAILYFPEDWLTTRQANVTATAIFVAAAITDWLDGYFARKYGMVTTLGRILDPFVDKIIICGTFICLVADPNSGVYAWMAVVVVGR